MAVNSAFGSKKLKEMFETKKEKIKFLLKVGIMSAIIGFLVAFISVLIFNHLIK